MFQSNASYDWVYYKAINNQVNYEILGFTLNTLASTLLKNEFILTKIAIFYRVLIGALDIFPVDIKLNLKLFDTLDLKFSKYLEIRSFLAWIIGTNLWYTFCTLLRWDHCQLPKIWTFGSRLAP